MRIRFWPQFLAYLVIIPVLLLGFSAIGVAKIFFDARMDFSAGDAPSSVAIDDLNGDGVSDLAVANYESDNISILFGVGDGTFATAVYFSAGDGPQSVAIDDLNGDGFPDLAVANRNIHNISILFGDGGGAFETTEPIEVGQEPYSIATGDLDGNGFPDLAVANRNSDTISILLSAGGGLFEEPVDYPTGEGPRYVAINDLDGDGTPDLAVANRGSSNISILRGAGDGTFVTIGTPSAGDGPLAVAIGDLDSDGVLDLTVANYSSDGVSILLGVEDGSFEPAVDYGAGDGPISVAIDDFDGDGFPDLAVANLLSNDASILLGIGDGTFNMAVHYGAGDAPQSIAVDDLNGDGAPDLSLAIKNGDSATILLGAGDGTFKGAVNYGAGDFPRSIAADDFNGDGISDLAVANRDSNNVSILLGAGAGSFEAAVNYDVGVAPLSIAIDDFDRDGAPDFAVANAESDNISILLGNGDGTFESAAICEAGEFPLFIATSDLDGDGNPDLSVVNATSDNVSIILGDGDGTFQAAVNHDVGNHPRSVAIDDLNGDGFPDLAVANANSDNISILLGTGGGNIFLAATYSSGGFPTSLAIADLNGDGYLDLAIAGGLSDRVAIGLGRESGISFETGGIYSVGNGPKEVDISDLNGDGTPDLVVVNSNSHNVSVLVGVGDGNFETAIHFGSGAVPYSVAIRDLDGDGVPDLAVANGNSGDVSVLINESSRQEIHFEEYPAGTHVTDQYSNRGAVFEILSGDLQITNAQSDHFIPVSGDRVFADPADEPTDEGILKISFFLPGTSIPAITDSFSCYIIDAESIGATVTAFDSADQQIFQEQIKDEGPGSQTLLHIDEFGIAKVFVTLGQGVDASAIDAIDYTTPFSTDPVLVVTPVNLSFDAYVGGGNPPSQIFEISNRGQIEFGYAIANSSDWITVFPEDGGPMGPPEFITVSLETSELTAGSYTEEILVDAPGALNSPQTVEVTLTLLPPPTLVVLPSALEATACEGGSNPADSLFQLGNSGGGEFNYTISAAGDWLAVSPSSGTVVSVPVDVAVAFDITGLAHGIYSEEITVDAPGAQGSPQTLPVTLTVMEPPDLVPGDPVIPPGGVINRPFEVSWRVTNTGDCHAAGEWTDRLFISENPDYPDGDDVLLDTIVFPDGQSLESGQWYDHTRSYTLPDTAMNYWIILESDFFDDVEEGDGEAYNVSVSSSPIVVIDEAVRVLSTDPAGETSAEVSSVLLTLSAPVQPDGANDPATYQLVHLGQDEAPGGGDDSWHICFPSYDAGSMEISADVVANGFGDLSGWAEADYANDGSGGDWQLAEDGLSVVQAAQSRPTFFISDGTLEGARFRGRFGVETADDDDHVGFVFGLKLHGETLRPDDYYLFTWKQATQGSQERGLRLLKVTDSGQLGSSEIGPQLGNGEDSTNVKVLDELLGIGWLDHTPYEFDLFYYDDGSIDFTVRQADDGTLVWGGSLEDEEEPHGPGRVGFYNYSQLDTHYSFFQEEEYLADGTYQLTVSADDPGLRGLEGVPLDGNDDGIPGGNFVTRLVIDSAGPVVTGHSPNATVLPPLSTMTLDFDEELDQVTLDGYDVQMTTPNGIVDSAEISVTPIDADSFEIAFPEQTAQGDYSLVIGPDICDPLGNCMDPVNAYNAAFTIGYLDLEFTELSAPPVIYNPQPFQVTWTVTNTGLVPVSAPWSISFYWSESDDHYEVENFLGGATYSGEAIAVGVAVDASVFLTLPALSIPVYILGVIEEEDEDGANNTVASGRVDVVHELITVLSATPSGATSEPVTAMQLQLSGAVDAAEAGLASTYEFVHLGEHDPPGGGDDRWVNLSPGYSVGSSEIDLQFSPVTTLDLEGWSATDYFTEGSTGYWEVDADWASVAQRLPGEPTFFVSDSDLIDDHYRTRFEAETILDDDFIGIVFGLSLDPVSGSPDSYYLLNWKQLTQGDYERGIKLLKITDSGQLANAEIREQLADGEDSANVEVLAELLDVGWENQVQYEFNLHYHSSGLMEISLHQVDNSAPVWQVEITDSASHGSGRYGFFTDSQQDVRFSAYQEADRLADGTYRLTAYSGNPGLHGIEGLPVDGNNDNLPGGHFVAELVIDSTGPTVAGHMPNGPALPPVSGMVVDFEEEVDAASFSGDDIEMTTPSGVVDNSEIIVTPIDGDSFDVVFPEQTEKGGYTLVIGPDICDPLGNCMDPAHPYRAEFTISAPDLVVTPFEVPASVYVGQPFTVNWTVTNLGSVTAEGPWTDRVYHSLNAEYEPGIDPEIASITFAGGQGLEAGGSYSESITAVLPAVPEGYRIIVVTDRDEDLDEYVFEDNNERVSTPIIVVDQLVTVAATNPAAGWTSAEINSIHLNLSAPVEATGANSPSSYQLLGLGYDGIPDSDDDTVFEVTPNYLDGATEINLRIDFAELVRMWDWTAADHFGDGSAGDWWVSWDGRDVVQQVSGEPTYFTSDIELIDRSFFGSFGVETTEGDGFQGVVFGYSEDPVTLRPEQFYLLSWKQAADGSAEQGLKLLRLSGCGELENSEIRDQLWDGEDSVNVTVLDELPDVGWDDEAYYSLDLWYGSDGQIEIALWNADDWSLVWQTMIVDPQPLGSGRVGFFTFQQESVWFFGSVQAGSLGEGAYQLTVRSGDPGLRGSLGIPMDGDDDGLPGGDFVMNLFVDQTPPTVISHDPDHPVRPPVSCMTIELSGDADPATFSNADLELATPSGTIPGGSISVTEVSPLVYDLCFPEQIAEGDYTMQVGPDICDTLGSCMVEAYPAGFSIDTAPPQGSISPSGIVTTAVDEIQVVFDGAMNEETFGAELVMMSGPEGLIYTGQPVIDPSGTVFTIPVLPPQIIWGDYLVTVSPGVEDVAGNALPAAIEGGFTLDSCDLAVTDLNPPPYGVTGQSVEVSWSVANDGSQTAHGPWTDKVFISLNESFEEGLDPEIGSALFPEDQSLAPEDLPYHRSIPCTLPGLSPDNYYIIVVANFDHALAELEGDNENNIFVAEIPTIVEMGAGADLVVDPEHFSAPSSGVYSGMPVPVTFRVTNEGTLATEVTSWLDTVFISSVPDLTWDGIDDSAFCETSEQSGYGNPSYLPPGGSYDQTVYITLPEDQPGTFYVYAIADRQPECDSHGLLPELDEGNNLGRSEAFAVQLEPQPDLQAQSILSSPVGFSGFEYTISWEDCNIEHVPEESRATNSGSWVDRVYFSENADPLVFQGDEDSPADILIGSAIREGSLLDSGECDTSRSLTVLLPDDLAGNFYVKVFVDAEDQISEMQWNDNNVGVRLTPVEVVLNPAVDLSPGEVIPSLVVGTKYIPGHILNATWSGENTGAPPLHYSIWYDRIYLTPNAEDEKEFNPEDEEVICLGRYVHGTSNNGDGTFSIRPYSKTRTVRLPDDTLSRTYFLVAVLDAEEDLFEGQCPVHCEENNVHFSGSFEVAYSPTDLELRVNFDPEHTLPVAAGPHQEMTISWMVTNVGEAVTPVSSWRDGAWLIPDDPDDVVSVLTTVGHGEALEPGASYIVERTVSVPDKDAGEYSLAIKTDFGEDVFEFAYGDYLGEENNVAFSLFTVTPEGPDLDISPTIQAPKIATAGETVHIEWDVANAGTLPTNTGTWIDKVYLSRSGQRQLPVDALLLGARTHSGVLEGVEDPEHNHYTLSGDFTIPFGHSDLYYIVVETDSENQVSETNDENNTEQCTMQIDITGVEPDYANLTVPTVLAPDTAVSGQEISITWQVLNTGEGSTDSPAWYDGVYLSRDQFLDINSDRYLGSFLRQEYLDHGANYDVTESFLIPLGVHGQYYVFVLTDRNDQVNEDGREGDNDGIDHGPVNITLPPQSDLTVNAVAGPITAKLGEYATFTWRVQNIGEYPVNGAWQDSIYLSVDAVWGIEDRRVGTFSSGPQILNPGEGVDLQGTFRIPAVTPGLYYVYVRTDVFNQIPEVDEVGNNLNVSDTMTAVSAVQLGFHEEYHDTLSTGERKFYELGVPHEFAGKTISITLDHLSSDAWTELYVKDGATPTEGDFDYIFNRPAQPDQTILIPEAELGTYYILAKATAGAGGGDPHTMTMLAERVPFGISAVYPGLVGDRQVTLRLEGSQWEEDTTFTLRENSTHHEIHAQNVLIEGATSARALFDLSFQPHGTYDVLAASGDESGELINGLVVTAATPLSVVVEVESQSAFRPNREGSGTVYVTNAGNIDAPLTNLYLWKLAADDVSMAIPEFDAAQFQNFASIQAFSLVISNFPPGETIALNPSIFVEAEPEYDVVVLGFDAEEFTLEEYRDGPFRWSSEIVRQTILANPDLIYDPGVYPEVFDLIMGMAADPMEWWNVMSIGFEESFWQSSSRSSTRDFNWLQAGENDCGFICDEVALMATDHACGLAGEADEGIDTENCRQQYAGLFADRCQLICDESVANMNESAYELFYMCYQNPLECEETVWDVYTDDTDDSGVKYDERPIVRPRDPNEKKGPIGFGIEQFVSTREPLGYQVYFENVPEASAPASRVEITDRMDPALKVSSFRLGDIHFGETTIDMPADRIAFQTTVDLVESHGVLVEVYAGIDARPSENRAFWIFQSIDPDTGEPPTETLLGFLPPNDADGRGEGWVKYTIEPWPGTATGTVIYNDATILFDENEPLDTNEWFDTTDDDPPESELFDLPAVTPTSSIDLSWWGEDQVSGSGIGFYTIHTSLKGQGDEDDSPFVPVLVTEAEETTGTFTGARGGGTYTFYSLATDNAGNTQKSETIVHESTYVAVQPPLAPEVGTATAATVTIDSLGLVNMETMEHAVYEVNRGLYVGADGRLSRTPYWQTLDLWAGMEVRALTAERDYVFAAKARDLHGETAPGDPVLVTTSRPGDVNGDGHVDQHDLNIVRAALRTVYGDPEFDARADLNMDDAVDSLDLVIVHRHLDSGSGLMQQKRGHYAE